jgi:hypothetical protein
MHIALGSIIFASVSLASQSEQLSDIFRSWELARNNVNSLIVEFEQENRDSIRKTRSKFAGTFKLLRTPDGRVYATLDMTPLEPKSLPETEHYLLNSGTIYCLNHEKKTAWKYKTLDGDLTASLAGTWIPCIALLDANLIAKYANVSIGKQDEDYTYLKISPKRSKRYLWLQPNGCLVIMREHNEFFPRHLPRMLRYFDYPGSREVLIDIKSWEANPANPPTIDDFARPESRAGWKVWNSIFEESKSLQK